MRSTFSTLNTQVRNTIETMNAQKLVAEYRGDLTSGFFETVIEQSKLIIKKDETKTPADVALYALGEVYVQYDFAGKDYGLSKYYFAKLIKNFPDSSLASEAKTFVSLFDTVAVKDREISILKAELVALSLAQKPEPPREAEMINPAASVAVNEAKQEAVNPEPLVVSQVAKQEAVSPASPPLITPNPEQESVKLAHQVSDNLDFSEAVKKNLLIMEQAGKNPPRDGALYNLGLIYAHIDNPAKDYKKSQNYFRELTRDFPDSPLAKEAQIWLGLFQIFEKMQQIDLEIEQQKKQLTR